MVFPSRLSVGPPPAHPPEERPPVEFVSWNAGFSFSLWHLCVDKQARRTLCGREIPRAARVSYKPDAYLKLPEMCRDCLGVYAEATE